MSEADEQAVLDMMRTFYSSDAVSTNGSDEVFKADIAACVGGSPYAEGYVFKVCGEYAGYGMLAKSFSTEFGKPAIWIEDAYVLPKFRGNGIGAAFFGYVQNAYPQAVLRLEAMTDNRRAIALYERLGFESLPYVTMKK